ncbi:hypothetical protein RS130_18270 [Paraglaciecola aquimarina]|uniref:Pectate lyase superfamily protein domain-containing protein n=1 Tax=Paraglaciecola aquimarina TaxID=1235557 RepID=A0ABU3SZZ9_9ALTE|nr:hypothetical protein [Paraglaciecola aquimarina]MDU0355584.1 hypothetical protein [Paraglaciecola aquimarina]
MTGFNWNKTLNRSTALVLLITGGLNLLGCAQVNTKQTSVVAASNTVLNVADYGISKDDKSDSTYAVVKLIEKAKQSKATKIVFPKGRYDFYPTRAQEHYLYVSNNDEGLKRVGFPFDGIENIEIDGQGSEFVFHGFMNPFLVKDSKHVSFRNFSVDFERPFHQEGKILAVGEGFMDLQMGEEFPYKITRGGILEFVGIRELPPWISCI